jgi:hypothetical protein
MYHIPIVSIHLALLKVKGSKRFITLIVCNAAHVHQAYYMSNIKKSDRATRRIFIGFLIVRMRAMVPKKSASAYTATRA